MPTAFGYVAGGSSRTPTTAQTEEHVDHAILGCGTVLSPGRGHLHVLEGTDKSEHGTGFL